MSTRTDAPDSPDTPTPPPDTPDSAKLKRNQAKAALQALLAPVNGWLLLGRALAVIAALIGIAPFIALVRLGDLLFAETRDPEAIRQVVNLLVGAFCGQLLVYFAALLVTHVADMKLGGILRRRIVERISRAPLSWFSATTSGRIRKAVDDDTHALHVLVAHAPVETTTAVASPALLLVYAFVLDWRLGLLAIATLPVYLLMQMLTMKDMGTKTAQMDDKLGDVSSTSTEFSEGITVVKAFGISGQAHRRYVEAARGFSSFYLAWVGPLMKVSAASLSVVSFPVILLVAMGGGIALVHAGQVTIAEALVGCLVALMVPLSFNVMTTATWYYQLAGHAALRLTETLNTPEVHPGTRTDVPTDGDIAFEHVTFTYPGADSPALTDVSVTLPHGSITALIGESGSGKSTLATLLARFADPDSGAITIGGVDIREFTFEALYRAVAVVLQDPQLLRISVRENIALARPDATDEEIWAAAEAANIAERIRELPDGLATTGAQFSGGEAQRISIARALLADAPILILDEATASTDPDAEAEIQEALTRLARGRTVLVIAHKPEAVRGVDQVIALERGRVADGSVVDKFFSGVPRD